MSNTHLSAVPMDPYEWRESVLSTRSLSYLSTADALGTPGSRAASLTHFTPRRRNTLNSDSDYGDDLEMADTNTHTNIPEEEQEMGGHLSDNPELPDSVANSLLFTLPREIRDRIYAFCLTAEHGRPVEWPRAPTGKPLYSLQPQLLRTCSVICAEALPCLYSGNTLTFHHPTDANILVRAMTNTSLSRRHITRSSFVVKTQDTRLWMPYITSTDAHRSLKTDFPSLRELGVRYRSNKWNHAQTVEQNMKNWWEGKIGEVMDGLRLVYYPPPRPLPRGDRHSGETEGDGEGEAVRPVNEMGEDELWRFVNARNPGEDMEFKRHLLELHKAHVPLATTGGRLEPPTVKVVCACRVHSAHFSALTTETMKGPGTADGQAFHGFSVHDFRVREAGVARTHFADRHGILIALEVYCADAS